MGSYWKECLPFPKRIRNVPLARGIEKVMVRMLEIDPAWAGGRPYYAWGFYDINIPRILGGNLKEAEEAALRFRPPASRFPLEASHNVPSRNQTLEVQLTSSICLNPRTCR
jgi:hypothetical protein